MSTPSSDGGADSRPEISVVMPSYNSGPFLGAAMTSVLSGPGPSRELLIQDGQSDDGTVEIVTSFDDPRIRFVSEPDDGQTDAINRAVKRARGEWILWLNADDALAPGALEAVSKWLQPDVAMVHGDWAMVDAKGDVIRRYRCAPLDYTRLLRHGAYVYHGAMLIRRSVYEEAGPLDASLTYCMDYEFLLRVLRLTTPRHCGACLALFRMQPASKTATSAWRQYREHWQVARRYGAFRRPHLRHTFLRPLLSAGYLATRPFWHSRLWKKLRPVSGRGGGRWVRRLPS